MCPFGHKGTVKTKYSINAKAKVFYTDIYTVKHNIFV